MDWKIPNVKGAELAPAFTVLTIGNSKVNETILRGKIEQNTRKIIESYNKVHSLALVTEFLNTQDSVTAEQWNSLVAMFFGIKVHLWSSDPTVSDQIVAGINNLDWSVDNKFRLISEMSGNDVKIRKTEIQDFLKTLEDNQDYPFAWWFPTFR